MRLGKFRKVLVSGIFSISSLALGDALPLAIADLPADLQVAYGVLSAHVVDPSEQDEYRLDYKPFQYELNYSINYASELIFDETLRLKNEGLTVKHLEFIGEEDVSLTKDVSYVHERIFALSARGVDPFFCDNLKNRVGKPVSSLIACKLATRKLLNDLLALDVNAALVLVDADFYGDYRRVVLSLRSKLDERAFLRIVFDVIHEV